MYRIKDWDTHFETSETRKYVRLGWVPVPNKHDGFGYRTLISMINGFSHYAAWVLILQIASKKKKPRGDLTDDKGTPLTPRHFAVKTGAPEQAFIEALPALIQVGWLEYVAINLPEHQQILPESPGTPVTNRIELNRIELITTTSEKPTKKPVDEIDGFAEFYKAYPRKEAKGAAERAYRTALKHTDKSTLLNAAVRYSQQRSGEDAKFTAQPASWLNGKRWLDETPKEPGAAIHPPAAVLDAIFAKDE